MAGFLRLTAIALCVILAAGAAEAQSQKYGALAYDNATGAWGYSFDFNAPADARRRALNECAARSPNCRLLTTFSNACAALATASDHSFGWAVRPFAREAAAAAHGECVRHGGINCQVVQAWCSR